MDFPLTLIPVAAFIIGFICSQAGVSGAFLILPFQVSILGFVSPSVNATNFLYNIIAIPGGVYRYWKESRMILPLAVIMIVGYIPGIYAGSLLRTTYLLDPKSFKLFVGLVLLYISLRLLKSSLMPEKRVKELDEKVKTHRAVKGVVRVEKADFSKISFNFWGKKYSFSSVLLFFIAFAVGVVSGGYGVGGGSLMAPLLVTFFRLPVHTIAGATLLGTFTSSVIGIVSFTSLGYPPDLKLGILLGLGGLPGIYVGARFQKYVPEAMIRAILSLLIVLIAARYIAQYCL